MQNVTQFNVNMLIIFIQPFRSNDLDNKAEERADELSKLLTTLGPSFIKSKCYVFVNL